MLLSRRGRGLRFMMMTEGKDQRSMVDIWKIEVRLLPGHGGGSKDKVRGME